MQHADYITLFEDLARSHHLIRHHEAGNYPSGHRKAFFRMNHNLETQQDTATQIDYPCLCLPPYRGRLADNTGVVQDVMTGFFEIRQQVSNPLDFAAVETARDACKRIGLEIIARLLQQIDDDGNCGVIENLNAGSVQYDFTGPINNSEYGCLFFFDFTDTAFNPTTADLSGVFL